MTRLFCLFALFAFALLAQVTNLSTTAIAVDNTGSVYAGTSASATVTKRLGTTEKWHVSLSSNNQDRVLILSLDPDGNIFAAGSLAQGGFISKLSATGERLLFTTVPAPVRALAMDANGSIYVGGAEYLQKFDAEFRHEYSRNIPGSIAGLAVDAEGSLHAAIASGTGKALVIEFSREGEVVNQLDIGVATLAAIALDGAG